ncbi:helix-turn-helix transcriptional regulator [Mucilaginibacter sp. JRF]|uniref:helix-turn-helix domain-containing protein n=1 Tax=Mucilaginibacter sp. JRF TaxID=2780088 RepID=UPI00187F83F5|nr:helix-turn-helix transcriptional regulator [Mucilaginibacter sp. JRF]MBE9586687.1 helix-turn-helix transcriptional regulator [Mucilaginibacter sp. JRF]
MFINKKKVANYIRNARLSLEFSQEYMAAKMSISQKVYIRMELGNTDITIKRLNKQTENEVSVIMYSTPYTFSARRKTDHGSAPDQRCDRCG